jgi:hypothetical protein
MARACRNSQKVEDPSDGSIAARHACPRSPFEAQFASGGPRPGPAHVCAERTADAVQQAALGEHAYLRAAIAGLGRLDHARGRVAEVVEQHGPHADLRAPPAPR